MPKAKELGIDDRVQIDTHHALDVTNIKVCSDPQSLDSYNALFYLRWCGQRMRMMDGRQFFQPFQTMGLKAALLLEKLCP